jgi:hypothetical protein
LFNESLGVGSAPGYDWAGLTERARSMMGMMQDSAMWTMASQGPWANMDWTRMAGALVNMTSHFTMMTAEDMNKYEGGRGRGREEREGRRRWERVREREREMGGRGSNG